MRSGECRVFQKSLAGYVYPPPAGDHCREMIVVSRDYGLSTGWQGLDNPALDTTSAHGKLLLNILGSIAEFERELIKSTTSEGRIRAKATGVRFGRKPALTEFQRSEAIARRAHGETLMDIARSMNVSHSTISWIADIHVSALSVK